VFVYGRPATSDVDRPRHRFHDSSGGEIYLPYAFIAERIVTVYTGGAPAGRGSANDRLEDNEATIRGCSTPARRCAVVRIRRPVVVTGAS